MTLTIEFPPDVETRLGQAARARRMAPDEYVRQVVAESLAAPADAVLELLARWEAEDATDDPAELAARKAECEELETNLSANRVRFGVPRL